MCLNIRDRHLNTEIHKISAPRVCLISLIDTLNTEVQYNTGNKSVLNMNNKHMRKMIDIYSNLVSKVTKVAFAYILSFGQISNVVFKTYG